MASRIRTRCCIAAILANRSISSFKQHSVRTTISGGRRALLALAVLLACAGCSPSTPAIATARLEGTVTYRGRAVENGGITFGPQQAGHGKSIWAPLVHGGYVAPAVPIGKVTVQINAVEERGTTTSEFGATVAERVNIVPAKYRGGVVIDVRGDMLDQNFELSE